MGCPYSQSGGAGTKACLNVDYKIPFPYHFPQSFFPKGPAATRVLCLFFPFSGRIKRMKFELFHVKQCV